MHITPTYTHPHTHTTPHHKQERQEQKERQHRQKQEREAEQERLGREAKEREEESKRQEMAELKRKLAQEKLEALKKTAVGARVFADVTVEVCVSGPNMCLHTTYVLVLMGATTPGSYQLPFSCPHNHT